MNKEAVLAEWGSAADALIDTRVMKEQRRVKGTISRAYYAIMHAARAALLVHDVSTSSHEAVRKKFGEHVVKRGEIEREWGRMLHPSARQRQLADYGTSTTIRFTEQDADSAAENAEKFVQRTRDYLLAAGLTARELDSVVDEPRELQ